mgnify:CR=1 FL=1|tara:strand:+ start:804 stop:1055 length:252 start_codon:yes stop_codon:yes gene_type:complete
MDKVPQPYVDPNFSEPPEWIVNVQLKEWRDVPSLQKSMMIRERIINARNIEELNTAYNLRKIENNLNKTKDNYSYQSGNKGMS